MCSNDKGMFLYNIFIMKRTHSYSYTYIWLPYVYYMNLAYFIIFMNSVDNDTSASHTYGYHNNRLFEQACAEDNYFSLLYFEK